MILNCGSVAWALAFFACALGGFTLGLPGKVDCGLRGQSTYHTLGGTTCEMVFEVSRRVAFTRIDAGSSCLTTRIYRAGEVLKTEGLVELTVGDQIRVDFVAPRKVGGTARGELRVLDGESISARLPWRVECVPALEVILSEVMPDRIVSLAEGLDLHWKVVDRRSKAGWKQRAQVTSISGARLVGQGRNNGDDEEVLHVLTRMELDSVWGCVSRGRVTFTVDGESCSGYWAVPIDSSDGLATSGGLVRVRAITDPDTGTQVIHEETLPAATAALGFSEAESVVRMRLSRPYGPQKKRADTQRWRPAAKPVPG